MNIGKVSVVECSELRGAVPDEQRSWCSCCLGISFAGLSELVNLDHS